MVSIVYQNHESSHAIRETEIEVDAGQSGYRLYYGSFV